MDAATSDKILGYFIEEAKEHLETLEKGILDLSTVVNDTERINELFRAAHSLKGGAAMLNLSSIQKTSHRLEDAFKILRDGEATVDQKLEELFWDAYDVLQDLIERLQSALGLQEDEAEAIVKEAEPTFVELQEYLQQQKVTATSSHATSGSYEQFSEAVIKELREMLNLFKQTPNPDNRHQLQQVCNNLQQIAPDAQNWQNLVGVAKVAIANPKHSYELLAPVIIKELKQGGDYLELEQHESIAPSLGLERLAQARTPQVLLTVEPKAAASVLLQVFDQVQVSELITLLQNSHT
ncbi:Hpt domain-containing protein [Gloeocapsa sp. PCC 73106]|uniref:Hpt domain-containing protein n=1 Tax=Gloeocapsa sp. PCC 73106 TaxID=102232 RepID=UPI0002ABA6F8|nr:Hpt domain-containing protein [Gloeocapsa sp. PCC 73106]ELR99977.1 chemotaxis protein histidine kinase-like protein [Gloeocapsa sp. PCC 73106]